MPKVFVEGGAITGPLAWAVTGDSAANTAKTISKAAPGTDKRHVVTGFSLSVSGAAAAGDTAVELKDDATTIWKTVIGQGGARGLQIALAGLNIAITANKAVSLSSAAAGASCVITLNLTGYTEEV